MNAITGLSESEVLDRRKRGEGNDVEMGSSRSYGDIIKSNVFTLINIVLVINGTILVLLGSPKDAIFSVGLVALNVVVSVVQEVRAKRTLDKIAVLTRPQVAVIREGSEKEIDPAELVRGDILVVKPGDQLVVDGAVIGDGTMELDESLLTGESDLIAKHESDEVFSGSFCVTGSAMMEAQKVGEESFANKMTADARRFEASITPLQKEINFVIRLLMLVAIFYGFLLGVSFLVYEVPAVRTAQAVAIIIGLIPNGLFLIIIIAYAMGAVRLTGEGALVQQSNAIESLSHVDILCTDKTGTLTANKINYADIYPLGIDREAFRAMLADFASSASVTNRTSEAIAEALGGQRLQPVDEVTFSSARKWSALAFDDSARRGTYVLGAAEMLQPYLNGAGGFSDQIKSWSDEGMRVLLFAHNNQVTTLHDGDDEPTLPSLVPMGLVSFSDELRPHVQETIAGFQEAGIHLKVISGDSPGTVAALAKKAGLPRDLVAVSGPDLVKMDDAQFVQTAIDATVFGRITPDQKERLVDTLMENGHYVAMIGDGVNDVLSIKKANVGVAMQSGSGATRGVADIVLLNDSFGALVPAFQEGQRIVFGMGDILRLFLSRIFGMALMIASFAIVGVGFPTVPTHQAVWAFFTGNMPTFLLALWARPARPPKSLLRSVLPFVFPAAVMLMIFGLILYCMYFFGVREGLAPIEVTQAQLDAYETYAGYPLSTGDDLKGEVAGLIGRSVLTQFVILAGILMILFAQPPAKFFTGGDVLTDDKRPTYLAGLLLVMFIGMMLIEPLRNLFEIILLRPVDYAIIVLFVMLYGFVLRFTWRAHIFERFLNLDYGSNIGEEPA